MSRYKVGDKVRVWKPGHAEHGDVGVVAEVIPIEQYYNDQPYNWHRGPHAYRCEEGFKWKGGGGAIRGFLPEAMVCSEEEFLKSG